MKPTIYMMLVKTFYAILTMGSALETADSYVNLISEIYQFSKSSSVELVYFSENDDPLRKGQIFDIRVLLMKKRITSTAVNHKWMCSLDWVRCMKYFGTRKDDSTMRVFFLTSTSDLNGLWHLTDSLSGNELINLVLFMESDDDIFQNECTYQHFNPFRFYKGVSVLFKCHGDPVIREWHSLNRYKMEMYERGTWRYGTGLTLKSKELILDDMGKLNGKILIVGTIQNVIFRRRQILGEIFTSLEQAGNVTLYYTKNHKLWNASTKVAKDSSNWIEPDIFGNLHVFVGESRHHPDNSEILLKTMYKFFIKRPERKLVVSWSAYSQPFTNEVWISLVLFFIVFQAIRFFMKTKLRTDVSNENSEVTDFFDICGMYCQQSLSEFPKVLPLRIFYCSIFFFSFIVMMMWSTTFIGELTVVDENLPFKSLAEFLEQRTHKLIVSQFSPNLYNFLKTTRVPLLKELGHLLGEWDELPKTDGEVFKKIHQGSNIALMRLHNPETALDYENIYSVTTIDAGGTKYLSFPIRKYSPYTRGINQLLKKLKCTGILKRIFAVKHMGWKPLFSHEASWRQYPSVDIQGVTVPFTLLLGGMILSILILSLEFLHSKRKLKTRKPARPLAARPSKRNKNLWVQNL